MKHIIDGKIYDTEKSEFLGSYIFFDKYERLYRTAKGNYFLEFGALLSHSAKQVSEDEAKDFLIKNNHVAAFQKLFGELEEA